jgi:hypothetical protein
VGFAVLIAAGLAAYLGGHGPRAVRSDPAAGMRSTAGDALDGGSAGAVAAESAAATGRGVSTTRRAEPEPRVAAASGLPIDRGWLRRFNESNDDFALAQEMVVAAVDGDARAEYLLGKLLLRCEVWKRTLAQYEGSATDRIERYVAAMKSPDYYRHKSRDEAMRCAKLFSASPFEGYGLPNEALDFKYWSNRAIESKDPVAVMERSVLSMPGDRSNDPLTKRSFRDGLFADVRVAVASGNPEALFMVGGLFMNPHLVANPEHGYAWVVAACELGYDCADSNPGRGGAGCVEAGVCVEGHGMLDVLQRDLGAAKYAAIYANAQDIQYKIKTGDWDGLQQYLRLRD